MSTIDVAGNSNREVPTFLQNIIKNIHYELVAHKCIWLSDNKYTTDLSESELNILLNYYFYNEGYTTAQIVIFSDGIKVLTIKEYK